MSPEATEQPTTEIQDESPSVEVISDNEEQPEHYGDACGAIDGTTTETQTTTSNSGGAAMRAVLTNTSNMWDNGTVITCAFVGPVSGTHNQRSKVMTVVREWERYANITFSFVALEKDAVVRISFVPKGGNWSYVGRSILYARGITMNLSTIGNAAAISDHEKGTILHEFGHTLGLYHEHQSPRRGETIRLNEAPIVKYFQRTRGWTVERIRREVMYPVNEKFTSNYSILDLNSIMMYPMPAEFNKQNIAIRPNNSLSTLDKAFIMLNYPPFSGIASGWTIHNALDAVGVTGKERDQILDEYNRENTEGIRAWFTKWCVNARASRWRLFG